MNFRNIYIVAFGEICILLSSLWRWITGKILTIEPIRDSATYMARVHGIDRRRHTRVKVPAVTLPLYPQLAYNNYPLPIVDMSIGGACVVDLKEHLSGEVGHLVRMDLKWPEETETLNVRIVAASRHNNRHLNFQTISPGSLARLSMIVRCGSAGQRMRLTPSLKTGGVHLLATELWTGVNGDSLALFDGGTKAAILCSCATTIAFFTDQPPRTLLNVEGTKSRVAMPMEVADALVCLVNIDLPTPRVSRLIESLSVGAHRWAKTGSGS